MLGMMKQIRRTQNTMEAIQRATMVMEMTPQGHITSVNANYQRFMNYDASELLDHHHAMLCCASYANHRAYYAFWQQLGKGICISGHFQRQTHSGRMVWLQATYTPIIDARGQVTRIIKIATPLSEQLMPIMMTSSPQDEEPSSTYAMSTLTLSPSGIITDINEQCIHVLGYTREQLIGTHHIELFIPESGHPHDDFWASLSHDDSVSGCFRYLHAHGHALSLHATYVPVRNQEGQITSFMMVGHHAGIAESPETEAQQHKHHPLLEDTQQMQNELIALMQQASTLSRRIHHMAQQANLLSINSSVDALRHNEQGRELAQLSQAMRRLSSHTAENMYGVTHDIAMLSKLLRHASHEAIQPEIKTAKTEDSGSSAEELIQRVADTLNLTPQHPHTRYVT